VLFCFLVVRVGWGHGVPGEEEDKQHKKIRVVEIGVVEFK
jgi:hypothetical protein